MSKSSKSCHYTGHMHVMNKENYAKKSFNAHQAESSAHENKAIVEQCHHKAGKIKKVNQCNQCSCKK